MQQTLSKQPIPRYLILPNQATQQADPSYAAAAFGGTVLNPNFLTNSSRLLLNLSTFSPFPCSSRELRAPVFAGMALAVQASLAALTANGLAVTSLLARLLEYAAEEVELAPLERLLRREVSSSQCWTISVTCLPILCLHSILVGGVVVVVVATERGRTFGYRDN